MEATIRKPSQPIQTKFCRDLIEVLKDASPMPELAVLYDVTDTVGHFHRNFDEVYTVLDGTFTVEIFDPATRQKSTYTLGKLESLLIPRGIHHVIRQATKPNRLCVLCHPAFNINDETLSPELR